MSCNGRDDATVLPKIISLLETEKDIEGSSNKKPRLGTGTNNGKGKHHGNGMHWILHWDINETILVGDESGGDSVKDCFNKIIAKSAFVKMPSNDADTDALCDYDNTSAMTPTHWWDGSPLMDGDTDNTEKSSPPPPLYTGWNWPKGCCPYYRTSFKRLSKDFVNRHGAVYKPLYHEIEKRLLTNANTQSQQKLDDNTAALFNHIIPAFFHTVYKLVHEKKDKDNCDSPITIVFRTFGSDLPNIAKAMTAFAQGKHPDYPDFVHPEYELDPSRLYNAKWAPQANNSGGENNDGGKPSSASDDDAETQERKSFQYQLRRQDDGSLVASGDQQVLDLLHDTSSTNSNTNNVAAGSKHYVFGIRDDYDMWKNHTWEPWAGKPVWITDHSHHHHLLMDDNIHNLPHDGIASVRRPIMSTTTKQDQSDNPANDGTNVRFESLSGPEIQSMQGLHLIRVPTIAPIMNTDWFLEQIEKAQKAATNKNI